MPYLTFEAFQAMGGTLDEQTFAGYESMAEAIMDNWTLNRLKSPEIDYDRTAVERAMFALIGYVPEIQAKWQSSAKGQNLTSFSNGVNSFGFGDGSKVGGSGNSALDAAYSEVLYMLPVDLISAAVSYNHAS